MACRGDLHETHHSRRHADSRAKVDREREYAPHGRIALVKPRRRQVRRVHRGPRAHRAFNVPRRRAAARHHRPPQRPRPRRQAAPPRGPKVAEAEQADARRVARTCQKIEEGFDDFDVAIATPDLSVRRRRLGRILGPSGKMPNPKVGTGHDGRLQGRRRVRHRGPTAPRSCTPSSARPASTSASCSRTTRPSSKS